MRALVIVERERTHHIRGAVGASWNPPAQGIDRSSDIPLYMSLSRGVKSDEQQCDDEIGYILNSNRVIPEHTEVSF